MTTFETSQTNSSFEIKKLIAFIAMVFGMFMAILDIQVVSASLAEIQAGLSASPDEISWVQTSYLIAEVIMIPLSGVLSTAMSTRYLFSGSCLGFTIMSFACAQATSLEQMIIFRALQGFIGGAMIPTVFASAYSIFPRNKLPIISPIIGLVATLAPTIGPTVGGYLTQLFSWHWLFLINLVPGIIVTLAVWFLVDFDKMKLELFKKFDWLGLIGVAAFLGALEYVLEEGPTKDWLEDSRIVFGIILSVVGFILFLWRAFTAPQPIVDLTAFNNRNFATGSLFSFVMGIGLYGLTYLYPLFLSRVRNYNSLQIGETMFLTGVCMFLTAPVSGKLMNKVDPRIMIAIGFAGFGFGTFLAIQITDEWSFNDLIVPQFFRGVSLMLCMIPINNISLGTLPVERLKNASGLFNVTRNLGGAVGLAIINTILNRREDLHLQRLHEAVNWANPNAVDFLNSLTLNYRSRGSDASFIATRQIANLARKQASVMAISDVFWILTLLFIALIFFTPLMNKPQAMTGGGGH